MMRKTLMAGAAVASVMLLAGQAAKADYIFDGSGLSGFLNPAVPAEPWLVGGAPPAGGDFGWGSPGVSEATTTYSRASPATNFEITFAESVIDPAQIPVGDAGGCGGSGGGGTTFCGPDFGTPWTAVLEGPSSIAFFAPAGVTSVERSELLRQHLPRRRSISRGQLHRTLVDGTRTGEHGLARCRLAWLGLGATPQSKIAPSRNATRRNGASGRRFHVRTLIAPEAAGARVAFSP